MVEILVAYAVGTKAMMRTCMAALRRHDAGEEVRTIVLTGDDEAFLEAREFEREGVELRQFDVSMARTSSGRHSRMLDAAIEMTTAESVLSLDSDCFPVVDGWLAKLSAMNCDVAGILWPWCPPPPTVGPNTVEYKLRSSQCWRNTHPACQMLRTGMVRDLKLKYADPEGYDTNFGLMKKVHAAGLTVGGLMPTRCPVPDVKTLDPEMNRHVCVVFGDVMYHHGGASREAAGEGRVDETLFATARKRILEEQGAEWLLEPGNSHLYRMDAEEDVAQFKMRMVYNETVEYLKTNRCMFGAWI